LSNPNPLYLIDAIGPFFRGYERVRINWSKIPWRRFRKLSPEDRAELFGQVEEDMERFTRRAAETGFNAVSLDDVPHLALHEHYEGETNDLIHAYREAFRAIFEICNRAGMEVFLTMDVMSWAPGLREKIGSGERATNAFIADLLERFFEDFPEVAGVIIRIGESDGLDVKDDFHSDLHLKNPAMVNRFLRHVLPVFEKHNRRCVFRTWTVGAHHVGDLIWRNSTLERSIVGIESDALILSMKYGESDFFRYLSLNRNFYVTRLPKIVELQTRREYEGAGEYPSFVGWDYESIADDLKEAPNVIGIMAWCQTGGWHPFRRLTWLESSSIWTEIDTHVTLRLFKHDESVETAIQTFPGCEPGTRSAWVELLRLSHEVVTELLYVPEFARQSLYFRRVRIPPLIGVYWHNIFVSHSIKKVLKHFVDDGEAAIRSGHTCLRKIDRMRELAEECGLPVEDIDYMKHTFGLLALAREYFFRPFDEEIVDRLKKAKKAYKKRYPRKTRYRYAVKLDFKPFQISRRSLNWFLNYCLREQHTYRISDRLFFLRFLSLIYGLVKRARPKMIPKFARKSAMGIDAIFR
tara:strand:- start:43994 stop:45727 length:1734 start_codon:yes stop_codon:yes gene_type:complete